MYRRDLLRGTGVVLGAGLVAESSPRVRGHDGGGDADGAVTGTSTDDYGPLGVVDVPGATEGVVGPDSTVYVATGDGYAVVDIADPTQPRVLTRRTRLRATDDDGPLVNVQDVTVDGDTLVVAGPAHPRRGVLSGLLVVDVSDPSAPVERGFYATEHPVHNCWLAEGRAYLTGNDGRRNPLVVVDVTGETPRTLGRWSLLDVDEAWGDVPAHRRTLHDVTVHDGVAVCAHWDAGTWFVDVSDPTEPAAIGRVDAPRPTRLADDGPAPAVTPPGNHHVSALDETGTLLAVGHETFGVAVDDDGDGRADRVVGGPSGITLWDVSDLSDPVKRATIAPPGSDDTTSGGTWTTAHNFGLSDGVLYSSWYQGGVKRHDVSDPDDPRETAWWRAPSTTSFWTAQPTPSDDGYFVATSRGVGETPGRLYTFPDTAGTQVDPPSDGVSATTASPVPPSAPEETVSSVSTPGFGLSAAVAAATGTLWYLCRRRLRKP